MSTTERIAAEPVATGRIATGKRPRAAWEPSRNDHLIFDWVKMKGQTQEEVATQLGISQATVSRIVQRYERWQARATDREAGRLAHVERLRAQRWLTYERNELFLASCVRIAAKMENERSSAKTTVDHGTAHAPDHTSRTQYENVDRHGIAARFYRLAFRINMDQLKLVSLDALPDLPPLSDEELEEELQAAAAAEEEIDRARRQTIAQFDENHRREMELQREVQQVCKEHAADQAEAGDPATSTEGDNRQANQASEPQPVAETVIQPVVPVRNATGSSDVHKLHKVHEVETAPVSATTTSDESCDACVAAEKISRGVHNGRHRPEKQPSDPLRREVIGWAASEPAMAGSNRTCANST